MFIEALADAGVAEGLKRPEAYQLAAQGVLGAAKLVLESGKHPGQLKDEVCSPSGSTIRGLAKVPEKGAFRGTVIDALRTTIEKARALNANRHSWVPAVPMHYGKQRLAESRAKQFDIKGIRGRAAELFLIDDID